MEKKPFKKVENGIAVSIQQFTNIIKKMRVKLF